VHQQVSSVSSFCVIITSQLLTSNCSFWYDKSWDEDPSLKVTYFHPSAKDCCALFFEAWNRDCIIENICDFVSPAQSPKPTPNPVAPQPVTTTTTSTAMLTANSSCNSALWHPTENYSACTNDFDYKVKWNYPPLKDTYLHKSPEDCCASFLGKECVVIDICASSAPSAKPTPKPVTLQPVALQPITSKPVQVQSTTTTSTAMLTASSSCSAALWHPTESWSACTNGFDYKGEWDYPPMKDTYLHESLDGCCNAFFNAWGKECVVVDICASSEVAATPHAETVTALAVSAATIVPPSRMPSGIPTHKPSTGPIACEARPFHPDDILKACTNR
jgi:hypothetical protein